MQADMRATICCLQALEDQNRALDEEVGELRELRDREGMSADVREMEHELKVRTAVAAGLQVLTYTLQWQGTSCGAAAAIRAAAAAAAAAAARPKQTSSCGMSL
jgi:hypothetical protein